MDVELIQWAICCPEVDCMEYQSSILMDRFGEGVGTLQLSYESAHRTHRDERLWVRRIGATPFRLSLDIDDQGVYRVRVLERDLVGGQARV